MLKCFVLFIFISIFICNSIQDEIPEQIDINQLIKNVTSELNSLKPRIERIYSLLGDITQEKNQIRKTMDSSNNPSSQKEILVTLEKKYEKIKIEGEELSKREIQLESLKVTLQSSETLEDDLLNDISQVIYQIIMLNQRKQDILEEQEKVKHVLNSLLSLKEGRSDPSIVTGISELTEQLVSIEEYLLDLSIEESKLYEELNRIRSEEKKSKNGNHEDDSIIGLNSQNFNGTKENKKDGDVFNSKDMLFNDNEGTNEEKKNRSIYERNNNDLYKESTKLDNVTGDHH